MKPGLTWKEYRFLYRRLRLARHILSSAGGIAENAYDARTLDRLETLQNKADAFCYSLDCAQKRNRRPKARLDE